jgi:hypothetical protein
MPTHFPHPTLPTTQHRMRTCLRAGSGGADELAAAEARLEEAVENNDINAITKALKEIERLQGNDAGRWLLTPVLEHIRLKSHL